MTNVESAAIDGSGNIGSWTIETALPEGRYLHGGFAHNGFLYVSGGLASGPVTMDDVIRIAINPDGSLGAAWEEAKDNSGDTLPRKNHACVVNAGYVYVTGGTEGTDTVQSTVVYAPILENGKIGTWVTAGNPFPTARDEHTAVVYDGSLYVIGGYDFPTVLDDIQYAPFDP